MSSHSPSSSWQVVTVGAGAAGLFAATRAAERGKRTLLLEKNRKPGVKILMSGGTRCNITHACDRRGIITAFGKQQGSFLHAPLAALSPQEVIARIEAEGVKTKVDERGKIFPVSDRATDVLAALLRILDRTDCEQAYEEPLQEVRRSGDGFDLQTANRSLHAETLIVTTGGKSYPGCGTAGDGYRWLAELGHTIVPTKPALTPITTSAPWVAELSGVTVPDTGVQVLENGNGKPLAERRESLLFTHFGLSGPAALDVSRAISGHPQPQTLTLACDFWPTLKLETLEANLQQECAASGKKQLASFLAPHLPRRLVEAIIAQAAIPPERRAAELSKAERRALASALKRLLIPVSGTRGFKKAEVTAGGVALDEVDSRTMQSKLVPNLYLAGEILDLDGPIGGYNFQAAFSTGYLAGDRV